MGEHYSTASRSSGGRVVEFAVDQEGVFTLSEGDGLEFLGPSPGEAIGRSAFDAYRQAPAIRKDLRRALSGEAFASVVEVEGTSLECRYEPIRDAEGAVVGAAGVAVVLAGRDRIGGPPREGEGWFARFVESSPDMVMVADHKGGLRYVNPAVERLLGYSQDEFFGLAADLADLVEGIIHPEDREFAVGELARAAREPGPRRPDFAVRARHKDGSWRFFEGHVDNLVDDPDVGGLVFVSRDVTERVRAEEEFRRLNQRLEATVEERTARLRATVAELEESEERFRLVSRATKEAIWDSDLLADRQVWDGAVEAVLGYPASQVTDTRWWEECVHPDDRVRVLEKVQAALKGAEETWSDEYRFRRSDGSYAVVVDRARVVRDPSTGEAARMLGSMADVTKKRRAEEALRESEELFRRTFEAAAVGMAHVAPDGRWLRINGKLSEIVGYTQEELLGLTFQDITHPDDLDADLRYVRRMLAGEMSEYSVEKRYVRKDRSRVWIELTVSLVRNAEGEPDYFVSVVEDITERKLRDIVPAPLTPRETEVLGRMAAGMNNSRIAKQLAYSLGTVKLSVRCILAKLGVEDRASAAARAIEIGLVSPPPP